MKLIKIVLILTSFLVSMSCDRNSNILEPNISSILDEISLKKLISIDFVDYDSVVVKNIEGAEISNKIITRIELGEKDTGKFVPNYSTIPNYKEEDESYQLDFSLPLKIYNKHVRAAYFTIRFIFDNNSWVDIDTFALTYKFPYRSTEIFLKTNEITNDLSLHIQDFEILGNKLYFYPLGFTIFYEYDLNSSEFREIMYFGSGDHIAGHSNYIFLDFGHCSIHRFNITEDTLDLQFDLSTFSNPDIRGLDVSNEKVYVMFPGVLSTESFLAQFDFDGSLISKESIPFVSYYLTIYENILYSVDYTNSQIIRYDLNSKTVLPSKTFPAESIDGICIYNDQFYFTDYYKQLISVIDLDLFNSLDLMAGLKRQIPLNNNKALVYPVDDEGQEINK